MEGHREKPGHSNERQHVPELDIAQVALSPQASYIIIPSPKKVKLRGGLVGKTFKTKMQEK